MILSKYNEIMNNITVDPEMKTRIMSAVSAAIKEQGTGTGSAETKKAHGNVRTVSVHEPAKVTDIPKEEVKAPVRRKAKKTPIIVISSIAAGIVVIMGVLFVFNYLGLSSSSPSSTMFKSFDVPGGGHANSAAEATTAGNYDAAEACAETQANDAGEYSLDAEADGDDHNIKDDIRNATGDQNKNTFSIGTVSVDIQTDASEGMGDARIDGISRALPFDMKGSGSGKYSDTISQEVFFGDNGEKVIVFTAPEGTDLVGEIAHVDSSMGVDGTTPAGIPAKFYRIKFGNVYELAEGETSDEVNAIVFNKDGMTYLIIFSDIQPVDVIGRVADAV